MIKVTVKINGVERFGSTFETEEKAQKWIDSQVAKDTWGKKEQIFQVNKVVPPMELISEERDFMGNKIFRVRLPADYEIEITPYNLPQKDLSAEIKNILRLTDWLFISDVPVDTKARVFYKKYRQMLRDMDKNGEKVETFEHWLKRTDAALFKDGGNGDKIIKKFNSNLGE